MQFVLFLVSSIVRWRLEGRNRKIKILTLMFRLSRNTANREDSRRALAYPSNNSEFDGKHTRRTPSAFQASGLQLHRNIMEWFDGVFSAALSASACLINFLMLSKIVRPEMLREYKRQHHEGWFLGGSKLYSLISGKRSQNHYSVNNKLMLQLEDSVSSRKDFREISVCLLGSFLSPQWHWTLVLNAF